MARHVLYAGERVLHDDAHDASAVFGVGGQIDGHRTAQRPSEQANLVVVQVVARQQVIECGARIVVQALLGRGAGRQAIAAIIDNQHIDAAPHDESLGILQPMADVASIAMEIHDGRHEFAFFARMADPEGVQRHIVGGPYVHHLER